MDSPGEGWRLGRPQLKTRLVLLLVALNLAVIAALVLVGGGYEPYIMAPLLAAILVAELVRAIRLALIAHEYFGEHPWRMLPRALLARLLGNTVSTLTPSALGGELVRGLIVLRELTPRAIAVGLVDGLFDLYTNTLLALLLAPLAPWPYAAVPLALGVAATIAWLTGFAIASRTRKQWLAKLAETAHKATKRNLRHATPLSITAWLLAATGYTIAAQQACSTTPETAIASYVYAYLVGIIPLPGGLGAIDAWLAATTCPQAAAATRTTILVLTLATLPLLAQELGKNKTPSQEHGYA